MAWGALAGAAAATVLFLIAIPRETPRSDAWSGAPRLTLLSEPFRGTDEIVRARVEPGQPTIPLGVTLRIDPAIPDDEPLVFSVESSSSSAPWRRTLSAAEIRERLRAGAVLLLVPAADHPPGRYDLRLHRASTEELLLEIPFEIAG